MEGEALHQGSRSRTRRRWFGIMISGVLLGLAGVLAGRLVEPSQPALLEGLPVAWDARNLALEHRVATQFPPGSPEAALTAELLRQGFTVGSNGQAKWSRTQFRCRDFVEIDWQAKSGGIVSTGASTFRACT